MKNKTKTNKLFIQKNFTRHKKFFISLLILTSLYTLPALCMFGPPTKDCTRFVGDPNSFIDNIRNNIFIAIKKNDIDAIKEICEKSNNEIRKQASEFDCEIYNEDTTPPVLSSIIQLSSQLKLSGPLTLDLLNKPKSEDFKQKKNDLQPGCTPLLLACTLGHLNIVKFLVEKTGKDFNLPVKSNFRKKEQKLEIIITPFSAACANGHLPVVKFLSEKKDFDLNELCLLNGTNPVLTSYENNHLSITKFLIEKIGIEKIKINQIMIDKIFLNKRLNLIAILIKNGLTIKDLKLNEPYKKLFNKALNNFEFSCQAENWPQALTILNGKQLNTLDELKTIELYKKNENHQTIFSFICENNCSEIIELIFSKIQKLSEKNQCPLNNYLRIIINTKDSNNASPLTYACKNKNWLLAKQLLDFCSQETIESFHNKNTSCLELAIAGTAPFELIEKLTTSRIVMDNSNESLSRPLLFAIMKGNIGVIEFFVKKSPDISGLGNKFRSNSPDTESIFKTGSDTIDTFLNDFYTCPSCFEKIKPKEFMQCKQCFKIFCLKCIKEWESKCLEKKTSLSCPYCRKENPARRQKKDLPDKKFEKDKKSNNQQ